jgi:hypothetical protein
MTTTGWIIWFACLGLGAAAVLLIGISISRSMQRDQDEREAQARRDEESTCIDCDRPMPECSCEDVLRCSCGIPDAVCVCAGKDQR